MRSSGLQGVRLQAQPYGHITCHDQRLALQEASGTVDIWHGTESDHSIWIYGEGEHVSERLEPHNGGIAWHTNTDTHTYTYI